MFSFIEAMILSFLGEKEQNEYVVEHYYMSTTKEEGVTYLKINIILGRRLMALVLTVYLPTILLTIISHATNYFKPFFFEASVTVNLTSLLVLVTLFVNVSMVCCLKNCQFLLNVNVRKQLLY